MKLIFCSHNDNKKNEIQKLLPENIELISLQDLDYNEEIIEDADTFEGNAHKKAKTIYEKFKLPCFSDDSGLEVEILSGEPGAFSARYAGEEKDDSKNMNLLLENLANKSNRNAQFKTVICLINENETLYFEGIIEGEISLKKIGNNGFGYDPIFKPKNSTKTFAEMNSIEKNSMSHRSIALKKMIAYLNK